MNKEMLPLTTSGNYVTGGVIIIGGGEGFALED